MKLPLHALFPLVLAFPTLAAQDGARGGGESPMTLAGQATQNRLHVILPRGNVVVMTARSTDLRYDIRTARGTADTDTALVAPAYPAAVRAEVINGYTVLRVPASRVGADIRIEVPYSSTHLKVDISDSGYVYVDRHPGDIEVKVRRGRAEVFDIIGPALVEVQEGPINATLGERGLSGALSLLTRRGNINLGLAMFSSANIDAETRRGMVVTNLSMAGANRGLTLTPVPTPRRALGRAGEGGALARLLTLEGGIMIIQSTVPGPAPRHFGGN